MNEKDKSWIKLFEILKINEHDFDKSPFYLIGKDIKKVTAQMIDTIISAKELRTLCYQTKREDRPLIFAKNNLFVLPVKNGDYAIIKGEGYIDIPQIEDTIKIYHSKLKFHLDTADVGSSEMQHLDFAYASSLVRTFLNDPTLVLTIRGKKRITDEFLSFYVGNHLLNVKGVQMEIDAGYEGENQIVLIEAKNSKTKNTLIRQLYYPYRFFSNLSNKEIKILFFEKQDKYYSFWHFEFTDPQNYNSIKLIKAQRYEIVSQ
jgi:hypothetical protein